MDNFNRDPRLQCDKPPRVPVDTGVCPGDAEMMVQGCPGNSFDIATRRYVMAVMGGHNVDPNAHFLKFKELDDKIEAISGGTNCSSIQVYDAYGRITNQICADLNVIVNGVLKRLATTDEITGISPSALPEITADIKDLQDATAALHLSVEGLTGTVESLGTKVTSLETSVAAVETKVYGVETDVSSIKTDVSAVKTNVSNIETKVADMETTVAGKQDALFFSSDFVTGGGNVSLNYGEVSEDSELPVRGKDIFASFSEISGTITPAISSVVTSAVSESVSGVISEEVSGAVVTEVKTYIPTITLNTL